VEISPDKAAAQSSINSIIIPTCDRPAALSRCLFTLLANLAAFDRKARILIADGSRTRSSQVDNHQLGATFKEKGGLRIDLIGHQERERLIHSLVSAGLDEGVVSFAMRGLADLRIGCVGSNRNLLLLMTHGQNFLSLDDDTEISFAAANQFRCGPAVERSVKQSSLESFMQVRVYHDRQSLQDSVQFGPIDFVGAHESILGMKVGDFSSCWEEVNPIAADTSVSPGKYGRVALTFSGLAGDCGWGTPSRYLFMSRESLERLTTSDKVYLDSITSREVVQLPEAVTLSKCTDGLMTTAFGADNRLMLPPFIPVGRGEDLVFGHVLQKTQQNVWFGHLPHAIFHGPVGRRQFARGEIIRSAATTDLSSLLCAMVKRLPTRGLDFSGSLRELGGALSSICAVSQGSFHDFIRECRTQLTQDTLAFLEDRLRSAGPAAPPSYVADVNLYIDRLLEGDKRKGAGIPVELLYGREIDEALCRTQELIAIYGQLLSAWPDIVDSANTFSHNLLEESYAQ
jgi:hypothetical protein